MPIDEDLGDVVVLILSAVRSDGLLMSYRPSQLLRFRSSTPFSARGTFGAVESSKLAKRAKSTFAVLSHLC